MDICNIIQFLLDSGVIKDLMPYRIFVIFPHVLGCNSVFPPWHAPSIHHCLNKILLHTQPPIWVLPNLTNDAVGMSINKFKFTLHVGLLQEFEFDFIFSPNLYNLPSFCYSCDTFPTKEKKNE